METNRHDNRTWIKPLHSKENTLTKPEAKIWRIGTWNVRGLTGKENELADEFDKASLDILAITETKKKTEEN